MALFRHQASGITPGESWSFSLHTTGEISLAAAQTSWSDSTGAAWTGALDGIMPPDVVMTEVSTAELDQTTGGQTTRVIDDVSRPGLDAGGMLPFQCAPAVSFRTAFATRWGRGRFYLPPPAVSVMAVGRLSTTAQNEILTAVQAMFSGLQGDGLTPVIWSRTRLEATTIVSIDVGDVIDTQRRRRGNLIEERVSANV